MVKTKIEIIGYSKENLEEFYNCSELIRQKIFQEDDEFLDFNTEIYGLINEIDKTGPTLHHKIFFKEHCLKNKNDFLSVDQLNRKFGVEISEPKEKCLRFATYFELEEVTSFFKKINLIEKLEGEIFVISKTFQ